jgi:lantibiotic modifying enzyme
MATREEIAKLGRSGAESVFGYVERMAEVVEDGVRWETLDYNNELNYNPSIFNGVAGICIFLADYFKLTGEERARELALGGLRWCSRPEPEREYFALYFGWTSVLMGWLHLAKVTGDMGLLENCRDDIETLLKWDIGPVTDIMGGASGNGLFLLRLWEATGDERYLEGAVRHAEWLREQAVRDEKGCYWPMKVGADEPVYYLGAAHGSCMIGYFLIALHEATGEEGWGKLAREVLETLSKEAKRDHGGLNWPHFLGGEEPPACQWCHGAPGVGLAYLKGFEVWKDAAFLETAAAAGEAVFAYGDVRENPSQCHGLAGNAELFIELYRITGKELWLKRAHAFAQLAFGYRETDVEGEMWSADENGLFSPDFMCGATGTGHFFLRLWKPEELRMPIS